MTSGVSVHVEQDPISTKVIEAEALPVVTKELAPTELEPVVEAEPEAPISLEDIAIFVEPKALSPTQKAIQNYFNQRYLARYTEESDLQTRLKSLCDLSIDIPASIQAFLPVRAKALALQAQYARIEALLKAFSDNDAYSFGREYFFQLKAKHLDVFQELIGLSPEEPRKALLETMEKQDPNSRWTSALFWASWIASPVVVPSRFFLPLVLSQKKQDYLASWAPETLDSQAKKQTRELATLVLTDLNRQLQEVLSSENALLNEICVGDQSLSQLIRAESSASLAALAIENTQAETYEDLLSKLSEPLAPKPSANAEIQEFLKQKYLAMMNGAADEKTKAHQLISLMNKFGKDLELRRSLELKREALLATFTPLNELMTVFNQYSSNKLIGPAVNDTLRPLANSLADLNKEINVVSGRLAAGNVRQKELFKELSSEDLNALIEVNVLAEGLEPIVQNLPNSAIVVDSSVLEEQAAADYFVGHYRTLVSHDAYEEELRLANLAEDLDYIDEQLKQLIVVRTEFDALNARATQLREVQEALHSKQANQLVLGLLKEREQILVGKMATAQQQMDSLAQTLVVTNYAARQTLLQETPAGLNYVLEMNKAARACISEYKTLKEKIALLNQINQGDRTLDTYVYEHNTWWVRLTDFLARFFSIFKTKASDLIDEAKELKKNLLISKEQCEQEIRVHIGGIGQDDAVGSELLADLAEQHNYQEPEFDDVDPLDVEQTQTLLTQLSLFKPKPKVSEPEAPGSELDAELQSGLVLGHC